MSYIKHKTPKRNTVYKRDSNHKNWMFRKIIKGKQHYFTVGPDLRKAKIIADQIDAYLVFNTIEDTIKKFNPNKADQGIVPTVEQLVAKYEKNLDVLDIKPRTFGSYKGAVNRFLKIGKGVKDPSKLSLKQNWTEVYNEFRRQMMDGREDEDDILSAKRTVNSVLRNMRGLVSEEAMDIYDGWNMEWVAHLKKLKGYKKVAVHYTLPSEKLISNTFDYLENLKCDFKFTMLALAIHAGMRRTEIAHCRRSWIKLSDKEFSSINIVNELKFNPKGYAGTTMINTHWAERIYSRAEGLDYLLPIDLSSQKKIDYAFEPLISDLRALGWDRNSPLHECRKLYGAYVATTQSLFKAQKYLRHTNAQITSDMYSDIIVSDELLKKWA